MRLDSPAGGFNFWQFGHAAGDARSLAKRKAGSVNLGGKMANHGMP
jgi:hypothetical protein